MRCLFYKCESLLFLPDISKWKISNVENMGLMFSNYKSLSILPDISKRDISKKPIMKAILNEYSSLSFLPDISNWISSRLLDINSFRGCISLSFLPDKYGFCQNLINYIISKTK